LKDIGLGMEPSNDCTTRGKARAHCLSSEVKRQWRSAFTNAAVRGRRSSWPPDRPSGPIANHEELALDLTHRQRYRARSADPGFALLSSSYLLRGQGKVPSRTFPRPRVGASDCAAGSTPNIAHTASEVQARL
jgi:hypothetical protein